MQKMMAAEMMILVAEVEHLRLIKEKQALIQDLVIAVAMKILAPRMLEEDWQVYIDNGKDSTSINKT